MDFVKGDPSESGASAEDTRSPLQRGNYLTTIAITATALVSTCAIVPSN